MPAQKRPRKIVAPPRFKGYKPYGNLHSAGSPVEIMFEEYEAIKLADYDGMNHQEASKIMGVSRATFARIYELARQKIAKAMVETRSITMVYGHARFDDNWFQCADCHAFFTIPDKNKEMQCAICRSKNIELIDNKL